MYNNTPLSQYLRLLRTNHNYKQDELANYLGVTRATYSHYETARLIPPTDSLYKLSAFYKVSLNKLVKLSIMSSHKSDNSLKAAADHKELIKEASVSGCSPDPEAFFC